MFDCNTIFAPLLFCEREKLRKKIDDDKLVMISHRKLYRYHRRPDAHNVTMHTATRIAVSFAIAIANAI